MIEKKGELLTGNTISLILGAAMIFVLIVLFVKILSPEWDRGEQTAKSYWKMLNEKLEEANEGLTAEMEILPVSNQGVVIYIVYFNNELGATFGEHFFFNSGKENSLSVCYSAKDENSKCLELPSKIPSRLEGGNPKWGLTEGESFTIKLDNNQYVFKKK